MTRDLDDEPMTPADFQALFGDEPLAPDPRADLDRGRSRRRRRTGGVVALVAVVALGGTAGAVLLDGVAPLGPVSPPSAVPSTPPAGPDPVPSASRTAAPTPAPRDTAPALRRDARGSYLDADGHTLGAPVGHRDPDVHPFRATTKNSWRLAVRHLDPSRDHLGDYEVDNFSGGSGEAGVEIGQKIGWTVRGDRGEGMVQLAVTRAAPGSCRGSDLATTTPSASATTPTSRRRPAVGPPSPGSRSTWRRPPTGASSWTAGRRTARWPASS